MSLLTFFTITASKNYSSQADLKDDIMVPLMATQWACAVQVFVWSI